tara:strand:+ start:56 stop:241 length:186 start_codon:yes stop_codon:yes gene_type:complete
MNGYNYQCVCKECGEEMTSRDFDHHKCPAIGSINIKDFASFEDYSKACDIAAKEWRKVVKQ